jgi:hypothetical protein
MTYGTGNKTDRVAAILTRAYPSAQEVVAEFTGEPWFRSNSVFESVDTTRFLAVPLIKWSNPSFLPLTHIPTLKTKKQTKSFDN